MDLIDPEKALSTEMRAAQPTSSEMPPRLNPNAAQMLTRIWLAAQAVWGHKWTSTQGDLPIDAHGRLTVAGQLWANGLRGVTERQVLEAFDRCARFGHEWPPNLPELRRIAAGIPDFEAVNHELLTCETAQRTPFARLVWSFIDGHQHRHARAEEAKRIRRDAYQRAVAHVLEGGATPVPSAGELEHRDPHPAGIPRTREARTAKLAELLGDDFHEDAANRSLEDLHTQTSGGSRAA